AHENGAQDLALTKRQGAARRHRLCRQPPARRERAACAAGCRARTTGGRPLALTHSLHTSRKAFLRVFAVISSYWLGLTLALSCARAPVATATATHFENQPPRPELPTI